MPRTSLLSAAALFACGASATTKEPVQMNPMSRRFMSNSIVSILRNGARVGK
jgi:hypothetical protein